MAEHDPTAPAAVSGDRTGLWLAIAAVVVGFSALGVSIYEAHLMRVQQRAMVWPILEVSSHYDDAGFSIHVTNKGIGPAIVREVTVAVDGEPVPEWLAFFRVLGGTGDVDASMGRMTGNILHPEEKVVGIQFTGPAADYIWRNAQRAEIRVCYCSALGDCWLYALENLTSDVGSNEEIGNCPENSRSRF